MRRVLDSAAALRASMSTAAADELAAHELIAPPLLWSEVHSAVHEACWRGELDEAAGSAVLESFRGLGVARRAPRALLEQAFQLATELGWAKTYDAEFLALARLDRATVLTTDARMWRGAGRTGLVITPAQL